MSKTYYNVCCFNDYSRDYTPWAKRQASKKVRRSKNICNGSSYKKVYNSYNICDFKSNCYSKEELKEFCFTDNSKKFKSSKIRFKRESIRYYSDDE